MFVLLGDFLFVLGDACLHFDYAGIRWHALSHAHFAYVSALRRDRSALDVSKLFLHSWRPLRQEARRGRANAHFGEVSARFSELGEAVLLYMSTRSCSV